LSLLLMTLVIMFAVCEVGIRVYDAFNQGRASATGWAVHDELLGYRPRPGVDGVNADGLRGPPVDAPKTRPRILILGDSVTYYGDGAADAFPGYLQRALDQDARAVRSEVLNAGVRGYTNYQELMYLKTHGVNLEPDLVGVAFVLNDLHRILHRFQLEDGKVVGQKYTISEEAVRSVRSPVYQLLAKSRFLVFLRRQLSIFDSMIDVYAGKGFTWEYRPDFANAWREDAWRDIEAQLREMKELGRARGFRVFVVAFPFGDQFREDYLARDRAYVTFPQRQLANIARRLDLAYLDLFNDIDARRDLESDRIHLTKAGREKAGARIARFLVDERLVPSATFSEAIAPQPRTARR
jgi:lysophospholipase L1-like esterase